MSEIKQCNVKLKKHDWVTNKKYFIQKTTNSSCSSNPTDTLYESNVICVSDDTFPESEGTSEERSVITMEETKINRGSVAPKQRKFLKRQGLTKQPLLEKLDCDMVASNSQPELNENTISTRAVRRSSRITPPKNKSCSSKMLGETVGKKSEDSKKIKKASRDLFATKKVKTDKDNSLSSKDSITPSVIQTPDTPKSKKKSNIKNLTKLYSPKPSKDQIQINKSKKDQQKHSVKDVEKKPKRKYERKKESPSKKKLETESVVHKSSKRSKKNISNLNTNDDARPKLEKKLLLESVPTRKQKLTIKNTGLKDRGKGYKQRLHISKKSAFTFQNSRMPKASYPWDFISVEKNKLETKLALKIKGKGFLVLNDINDYVKCAKYFTFPKKAIKKMVKNANACPPARKIPVNQVVEATSLKKQCGNAVPEIDLRIGQSAEQPDAENTSVSSFETSDSTKSSATDPLASKICKDNSFFTDDSDQINDSDAEEVASQHTLVVPQHNLPEINAEVEQPNTFFSTNDHDILDFNSMLSMPLITTKDMLNIYPMEDFNTSLTHNQPDENIQETTMLTYFQPSEEKQHEKNCDTICGNQTVYDPDYSSAMEFDLASGIDLDSYNEEQPDFKNLNGSTPVSEDLTSKQEDSEEYVQKCSDPETNSKRGIFIFDNEPNVAKSTPKDAPQKPEVKQKKTLKLNHNVIYNFNPNPVLKQRTRNRTSRKAQASMERNQLKDSRRNISADADDINNLENEKNDAVNTEDQKAKEKKMLHINKSAPEICNTKTTANNMCKINKEPQKDLQIQNKPIHKEINENIRKDNTLIRIGKNNNACNTPPQKEADVNKINKEGNNLSSNVNEITIHQSDLKRVVHTSKNYTVPKLRKEENKIENPTVPELKISYGETKTKNAIPEFQKPLTFKTQGSSNVLSSKPGLFKVNIENITPKYNNIVKKQIPTSQLKNTEQKFSNLQKNISILMSDDFTNLGQIVNNNNDINTRPMALSMPKLEPSVSNGVLFKNIRHGRSGMLPKMLSPIQAESNDVNIVRFGNSETQLLYDKYFPIKMHEEKNSRPVNAFSRLGDQSTRHLNATQDINSDSDSCGEDVLSINASSIDLTDCEDDNINDTEHTLQESAASLNRYLSNEIKSANNSATRDRIVFDLPSSERIPSSVEEPILEQNMQINNANDNNNQETYSQPHITQQPHISSIPSNMQNFEPAEIPTRRHTRISFEQNPVRFENENNNGIVPENQPQPYVPFQNGNSNPPAAVPSLANMGSFDFQLMMQTMPPPLINRAPPSRSGPILPECDPEFLENMRRVQEEPPLDLFPRAPPPPHYMRQFNNGYSNPQHRYMNRNNNNWRGGHHGYRGNNIRPQHLNWPRFEYQGNTKPQWYNRNQ